MQLTKSEKKIARELFERCMQQEFSTGLQKFDALLANWKSGKFTTNQDAYHALFKAVASFDKHIARRYDGLTGSGYFFLLMDLYNHDLVSDEDLEPFRPEVRNAMLLFLSRP